eukprot:TRINITY_DN42550_c0_g1_i1.p1 TRINITY_DN42550_c0_g1~~TRINITY_DN42550_c0_g1_i1.p1  ORF type:complete len:101 (-),score=13.70 TRINITY_DN42550_c0_g1_i1:88-390(-)
MCIRDSHEGGSTESWGEGIFDDLALVNFLQGLCREDTVDGKEGIRLPKGIHLLKLRPTKEQLHSTTAVSYTHLRAHETPEHLVCRLLLEKKKNYTKQQVK